MASVLAIVVLSYLLGSVPTSIIVSKVLKGIDIREHGSRNAGATNVYRVLGLRAALFVGTVDVGKGVAAVLLVTRLHTGDAPMDPELIRVISGIAAICGHIWTVFAGFRGGKAVNTSLGVVAALAPVAAVVCLGIWMITTFSTRYVSVGSMSAAGALPIVLAIHKFLLRGEVSYEVFVFGCVASLLVLVTHRSNIDRLLRGQENRFGTRGGGSP